MTIVSSGALLNALMRLASVIQTDRRGEPAWASCHARVARAPQAQTHTEASLTWVSAPDVPPRRFQRRADDIGQRPDAVMFQSRG